MKAQEALRKIKSSVSLEKFAQIMVALRYDTQFWGDVSYVANKDDKPEKKPDDYRT